MDAYRQRSLGFGLDVNDREAQGLGGGFGGLFVFGAEP